jgi:hypothetical protein
MTFSHHVNRLIAVYLSKIQRLNNLLLFNDRIFCLNVVAVCDIPGGLCHDDSA